MLTEPFRLFLESFNMTKKLPALLLLLLVHLLTDAQRTYSPSSVLSSGNWYKIAVPAAGVYKVDVSFLNSLGISTSGLTSSSIRLYGNGGKMLPESNSGFKNDDLAENPIWINDGGDGNFNGTDYFLFYADGPDEWRKDSLNKRFFHKKNIYEGKAYFFITIGGSGKRINPSANPASSNITVQSYNYRYFYENDTINFLNSGKEWYGEEFANAPGRTLVRNFSVNIPNLVTGSPLSIASDLVARSVGAPSLMTLTVNGQPVQSHNIPSVGAGVYDQFVFPSYLITQNVINANPVQVGFNYSPSAFNAQAWLNWFEINTRAQLSMPASGPLLFRDWNSVAAGNIAKFVVQNCNASSKVWDVTDVFNVAEMQTTLTGSDLSFNNFSNRLREYIAFNTTDVPAPAPVGRVNNQNIHGSSVLDYIIVTNTSLQTEANRLASFHSSVNGLRVGVFTIEQIYNEFSGAAADPTAIRDMVKMFYDRAAGDSSKMPKYLLLFGSGSFDYRNRMNNNLNLVPVYESVNSTDPLSTYTSDDFFGFLEDNEDINNQFVLNNLDIGVGRIPARTLAQARSTVDKIVNYHSPAAMGPWRNYITFVADDEDNNLHLTDAEIISNGIAPITQKFNFSKIYLDAYHQESGSGGSRYPDANAANNSRLFNGTLIWNYSGHGGYNRLSEEAVVDQDAVNNLNNPNKLPLFITATCDFAPFDNPILNSLGENLLLREKTGAIALMTTTRPVFAFSNRLMNFNYLDFAFRRNNLGKYLTLGEAIRISKNYNYITGGDIVNTRKFTLLGDPAMRLAFPGMSARITQVNGNPFNSSDTLKATEKYSFTGEVTDLSGNRISDFNGTVYPLIFDKPLQMATLANDPTSFQQNFTLQNNIVYKGTAAVQNGVFSFSFIVPRDINYQVGAGKISLYAEDGNRDAGSYINMQVGTIGSGSVTDNEGPVIRPYLNDEKFVNGGLVEENPILVARISDSSGINTTGTGIGHDLIAILDNDNRNIYKLNDFYEAAANSFQQGVVRFPLTGLAEGTHTIRIKAWDVLNNPGEATLEFRVVKKSDFSIDHVLNYPNPFTSKTTFWFEHNRPGEDLTLTIKVMTISGRVVKNLRKVINTEGNRSCDVEWDGTDDFGNKLARGVYIYTLSVKTSDGKSRVLLQKLAIL